jgi:hypothetical protein
MKVSSPVGDLPFEAKRLRWKKGTVVLEGTMGAWPARIVIFPRDVPELLKLMKWPLIALGSIVLLVVVLALVAWY